MKPAYTTAAVISHRFKAITTKHYGQHRMIASDGDKNQAIVTCDADTDDGDHEAAALALCAKMKWSGDLVGGELSPGVHVFVFTS